MIQKKGLWEGPRYFEEYKYVTVSFLNEKKRKNVFGHAGNNNALCI